MSEEKILNVGPDEATRALNDEKFVSMLPMFKTIRGKADVLRKTTASGCSSCRKRRIAQNLTLDFLNVLKSLPDDEVAKVKAYFGASKMAYQMFDRDRGVYRTRIV